MLAMAMAGAAPAKADEVLPAEKLRRLDIMLMVTGLRCRSGEDDFQVDFGQFEGRHMAELNAAAAEMRKKAGRNAERELDRLSTIIANKYGAGHPYMGCHELKDLAHHLAVTDGVEELIVAADKVFAPAAPVTQVTLVAAPAPQVTLVAAPVTQIALAPAPVASPIATESAAAGGSLAPAGGTPAATHP